MDVQQQNLMIVGVGDMKISDDPLRTLVTYSLGSCVGVVIYDPVAKAGGMLHAMLPEAMGDRSAKTFNPHKFVDTGIPLLFKETYKLGAKKNRMEVSVVGCAQIMDDSGFFNIGKRNLAMVRKIFWKNGVMVAREHVEGSVSRTVRLDISTGRVTLRLGWGEELTL